VSLGFFIAVRRKRVGITAYFRESFSAKAGAQHGRGGRGGGQPQSDRGIQPVTRTHCGQWVKPEVLEGPAWRDGFRRGVPGPGGSVRADQLTRQAVQQHGHFAVVSPRHPVPQPVDVVQPIRSQQGLIPARGQIQQPLPRSSR
jgi:hypothetical protein